MSKTEQTATPGPWEVRKDTINGYAAKVYAGDRKIAVCQDIVQRISERTPESLKEDEANARLIAAAPDLLEVLVHCEAIIRKGQPEGSIYLLAANKAKQAIAKAEGKQ